MSILCRMVEYALARDLANGQNFSENSWMRRHIERCPACESYRTYLLAVSARLASLAWAPEPPEDLVSTVMARLAWESSRGTDSRTATVARGAVALIAVLVVLAGFGWLRTTRRPGTRRDLAVVAVAAVHDRAATRVRSSVAREQQVGSRAEIRRQGEKAHDNDRRLRQGGDSEPMLYRILQRSRRRLAAGQGHTSAPVRDTATPDTTSAPSMAADLSIGPDEMARVGAYFEMHSDYRQAALAYSWASARSRDAGVAFAAGWAAEAMGDYFAAVEHYRQLLAGAGDDREVGKGASRS